MNSVGEGLTKSVCSEPSGFVQGKPEGLNTLYNLSKLVSVHGSTGSP